MTELTLEALNELARLEREATPAEAPGQWGLQARREAVQNSPEVREEA